MDAKSKKISCLIFSVINVHINGMLFIQVKVLKDLEKKHGKKWIEDNREMLEKDRQRFDSLSLL